MTQTLYRYWAGDDLLYIGISSNAYDRAKKHSTRSAWWTDADRVTFEHYPDRESVRAAERVAIATEFPRHNIAHAGKRRRRAAGVSYIHRSDGAGIARYLTVAEVSFAGGCKPETVRVALRCGDLPGARRGKTGGWRIRDDHARAWITSRNSRNAKEVAA